MLLSRPLIFCQLQVHFSYSSTGIPSHLVIHPMLLPTPFLDISRSLPLPPGTPITLLPYGTPAFFLACYTGPTTGLTKQFRLSLQGMGAGEWDGPSRTPVSDNINQNSTFIIGWIQVENKQGDDKGITIIYPTSLCLSYIPLSTSRAPLDYIPELPAPLQPSPQAPTVIPSVSAVTQSGTPAIASSTGTSAAFHPHRPSFVTSPTSESLHSFRALRLSKSRDLQQVATEVGGYVDAVARERERERERLKREREGGLSSSPKMARTTATTPASAPTPIAVDATTTSTPVSLATQVSPSVISGSSQQPLQPPMIVQNFYPSPPQSNPIVVPTSDVKPSPVVDSTAPAVETPTTTTVVLAPPLPIASSTSGSSNGYDPFGPMDTTWTQPAQNYLGMEIDMDFGMDDMGMNFGLNMASVANNGGSRGAYNDSRGSMEFEDAFTDDDFSFFDRPSRAAAVIAPPTFTQSRIASGSGIHPLPVSSLPAGAAMSLPLFGDINLSGPGPPNHSHPSSHNQQIWTPGGFMEGFTPRSIDHSDSIPPDLLPSSPGQTPDIHSAPATPNVHLDCDATIKRPSISSLFEPIPFAPYHRATDGKYAFGKFALPSPPAEDDLVEYASTSLPSSPNGANGWRRHYDAITDPRIGVVRKLIGVKRKTTFQQGIRSPPKKSPWVRAHEEWDKPASEKDDGPDVGSGLESDDDEDLDDIDSPPTSRPTTPAPSYLPLGPTLLHTRFQHSQLLPLSTSLRPPGAAVAPINLIATNTPLSVPTPVSPAAMMGQASEKSKSLEAAAFAVAAEVVENPIWAETWRANIVGGKSAPSVWSTDIKAVNQLLEAVPSLEAPVDMTSLFGLDDSQPLQALETPMIAIGKGDAVIHVLPTALRFWEKLGLGPKGGRKDLSAFVIFEEDGEQRQTQMENWLVSVGNVYQGKHFGSLSPGKSSVCPKDGLVPLRFDSSFRKSLSSFMSSLTPPQPTLIVFLVLPVTVMTLSSPVLRQILSASKKVLSGFTESQIVFEFVPEQFISHSMEKSSPYNSALDLLSSSVYNRILVPVDRTMARRIHDYGEPTRNSFMSPMFMSPTFTLSRPLCNKVSYVRAAHTSLDVMDRYTLLHVAYHLTACGKWILASCVDQRGEAYDLHVWLTQSPGVPDGEPEVSDEEYAVRKVWDFAMEFAKRANVEWRVVFARLGVMNEQEMSAWTSQLTVHVLSSREQPPMHHSVVCVEPDAPWLFIPSSKPNVAPLRRSSPPARSSPSSPKHQSVFTDISATTYALFPSNHMTISLPPCHTYLGLSQSFIPEPASTSLPPSPGPQSTVNPTTNDVEQTTSTIIPDNYSPDTSSQPHPITLMPLSTTTLIRVPSSSSLASIRMAHIHLLCTFHSYTYTYSSQVTSCPVPDNQQLHKDVTKNYHELAVLAKVRWKLDDNPVLPFHLAAVDAMRMSLDRDWDRLEVGGDS
ncbi:hypothetical protein BYT27DRAFT_6723764 [Phlegmacium glaucopus]|nr:hypothetical protein BYT27DRAFT_6723764 [Phlegmacium glaucopus]